MTPSIYFGVSAILAIIFIIAIGILHGLDKMDKDNGPLVFYVAFAASLCWPIVFPTAALVGIAWAMGMTVSMITKKIVNRMDTKSNEKHLC